MNTNIVIAISGAVASVISAWRFSINKGSIIFNGIIFCLGIIIVIASIHKEDADSIKEQKATNSGILSPSLSDNDNIIWVFAGKPFILSKRNIDVENIVIGGFNIEGEPINIKLFEGVNFKAKIEDGKIKVSTTLRDSSGNVIAEMVNNEWQVNRPQFAFDRNFNDTSLEIKDNFGDIVFQIEISGSVMSMNGKFVKPDGQLLIAFPLRKSEDMMGRISAICNFEPGHYKWASSQQFSHLSPLFKYPSSLHQSERENIYDKKDYNRILFEIIPEYPKDIKDSSKTYVIFN